MFGRKRKQKGTGVGVYSSGIKTCLAAVSRVSSQRPQVTQCAIIPNDTVVNEFIKNHNLLNACCVDVLSLNAYSLIQVDLQGAKEEEKRDAARWQIRELLDYPAEEAVVDLLDVPFVGEEGSPQTYVVAAKSSLLKQRINELKLTGLNLKAIDIPDLALRNLLSLYDNESRGHGLLWLQEKTSLLVICRDGHLFFSRTINVGMEQLRQHDSAGSEGFISEQLQVHLDDIVLEIQRSLDYCESNFHLPPVPQFRVAFCGDETELLLTYLNQMLDPDISLADFRQILDIPLEIDAQILNASLPALGAALRAGGR